MFNFKFLFLVVPFLISSCSVYGPVNSPLVKAHKKGDFQYSGGLSYQPITSPVAGNVSLGYAPLNNVVANASISIKSDYSYQFEGLAGFRKVKNNVAVGAFANYTIGNYVTNPIVLPFHSGYVMGDYESIGGLIQLSYQKKNIEYWFTTKISEIRSQYEVDYYSPKEKSLKTLAFEPGAAIVGNINEKNKVFFQYTHAIYELPTEEGLLGSIIDRESPSYHPLNNWGFLKCGFIIKMNFIEGD